jgi:hypothetical protein
MAARQAARIPRESSIQRTVMKALAAMYPHACVRKRHGSVFATSGDPDVYALIAGVHVELELKRPGESPTILQQARLTQWGRAGAHAAVIHSAGELAEFIAGLVAEEILPPPAV